VNQSFVPAGLARFDVAAHIWNSSAGAVCCVLVRDSTSSVPRQDLSIDLVRIPAVHRSRFVMTEVRLQ